MFQNHKINTDGKIMTTGVIKNIRLRGQTPPILFTKQKTGSYKQMT